MKETKTKEIQILDDLTNNSLEVISEALADKDKKIRELKKEIKSLEKDKQYLQADLLLDEEEKRKIFIDKINKLEAENRDLKVTIDDLDYFLKKEWTF